MATITAFEAKTRFGELLTRVANGEEIEITKYEKVVAKMIPSGDRGQERTREAMKNLLALKESMNRKGSKPLTNREILSARDAGRKY